MGITIKQRKSTYRIFLQDEEWVCSDRKDMEALLKTLLDLKDKYGQLKEND